MWIIRLRDIDKCILDMPKPLSMYQFLYLRSLTWYQVRMLLFLLLLLILILLLLLILNLMLIFLLYTVKEKEVSLYIHCITSRLMHIFPHIIMLLFLPLILILFSSLFQMAFRMTATMKNEMHASEENETWKLVALPAEKKAVGCPWIYIIKLNPDGTLAHLVTKGSLRHMA